MVEGLTINRVSTSDQIVAAIRDKILRGELLPGTHLHEISMADHLGVSRNTMREAIRVLVHEGLIHHSIHRGVTVTELRAEDLVDIYRVRVMLEVAGVKAAKHVAPAQLEELAAAIEGIRAAVQTRDNALSVEKDMHFHRCLVAFLGSRRLSSFHQMVLSELRLALVLIDNATDANRHLVAQHERLFELIRKGKTLECVKALREHLADSERTLRSTVLDRKSVV